jgi:REP element-mobilizing transposase RayT
LHGDARGFRDRGHRAHSSGDYRRPPPKGEHAGLHRLRKQTSPGEVRLTKQLRTTIGVGLVHHFQKIGYRLLAVAVTKVHAHALIELPDNILKIRSIVGTAKRISSRTVKRSIPGSVWAARGTYKPIKDADHQRNAFNYILFDQGFDAWTWSFHDATQEGQYRRPRPIAK